MISELSVPTLSKLSGVKTDSIHTQKHDHFGWFAFKLNTDPKREDGHPVLTYLGQDGAWVNYHDFDAKEKLFTVNDVGYFESKKTVQSFLH